MGNLYKRVGNQTLRKEEFDRLTEKDIKRIKDESEKANQKRLENMRRGLGLEPKNITLDVTPQGIAKRQAAIKAEEAKLVAEQNAVETPPAETKKSKGKNKKEPVTVE